MITTRLAGAALLLLGAGSLAGCGVLDYGCSQRDRNFSVTLDDSAILTVHPAQAQEISAGSGCDDDDGFAHAGREFRSTLTRDEIIKFHRDAATADGWQWQGDGTPIPSDGLAVSAAATCLTKEIDGTTVYLSVWFPSDFNGLPDQKPEPEDVYGLSLRGSHDGAAWC
ncbi:hypothetical protein [Paractinoplanes lichenicola]|uniref:Secreted protein n=1 Tax=Paractinoplanes lichenicola TaxID=2802976 RepID=A0ABS1W311_9ACTN|nr:hypothetical protein [Actinoplanes lichenicola]MBL7261126.1 hypothetical protein [Actinoplanes lichenicola]